MSEQPSIMVRVSPELLAELGEWSEPVQIMVEQAYGEWTMIARRAEPTYAAVPIMMPEGSFQDGQRLHLAPEQLSKRTEESR